MNYPSREEMINELVEAAEKRQLELIKFMKAAIRANLENMSLKKLKSNYVTLKDLI